MSKSRKRPTPLPGQTWQESVLYVRCHPKLLDEVRKSADESGKSINEHIVRIIAEIFEVDEPFAAYGFNESALVGSTAESAVQS